MEFIIVRDEFSSTDDEEEMEEEPPREPPPKSVRSFRSFQSFDSKDTESSLEGTVSLNLRTHKIFTHRKSSNTVDYKTD